MKKMEKKTKTGWPIPVTIKDLFVSFCAEKGNIAQEDCAGALFLWQYLTPDIRELARLVAKGSKKIDKKFWENFQKSLSLAIQEPYPFSDSQINYLWDEVEKIAEKVGVKINKPKRMTAEESKEIWARHRMP
jgi:hypothetical protein